MVLDHCRLRGLLLSCLAPVEDHLEGNRKEEQAAGYAERADRYPHRAEDGLTGDGEYGENAEGDERPAKGRAAAFQIGHAVRETEEDRRQTRRVDGHDERRERVDQLLVSRHVIPLLAISPGAARPLSRP